MMKCRRVKKLLPLYVEGDLGSNQAESITAHLDWCGQCNWLADEYKESQNWLRTNQAPEFDQAFLDSFKSTVMRRVEESAVRPSLLASIAQQLSRRQVLAMSGAMLIAIGMVLFYIYQTRLSVKLPRVETAKQISETERAPGDVPKVNVDDSQENPSVPNKHSRHQPNQKTHKPAPMANLEEPPLFSQVNRWNELGTTNEVAVTPRDLKDDSTEMLRIEIQTADPNIRIIWFTPKIADGPQTNQ
ncbi:MAG TPA: zf-HC2 domain-containing protein [Blastocatellia bacterium]|nr:zf-HC2 domain-containing protein [Blastocatellia bacterium]